MWQEVLPEDVRDTSIIGDVNSALYVGDMEP